MKNCAACKNSIPDDAQFCGFCGFRVTPIAPESHRRLSESLQPVEDEPIQLLTKSKKKEKPRLEIVDEGSKAAAAPTAEKAGSQAKSTAGGNGARPAKATAKAQKVTKSEARRSARFPLKIEVSYNSEHNFYTGFLENISSGGLFVATHQVPNIGDQIELTFSVPGLEGSCTAACSVRWVREYNPLAPDTIPGMGLQFQNLDADARAAIELFIKHREPIFFDDD